jgi:hypothetical protein
MAKFTGKGAQFLVKTSGATPTYVAIGQIQEVGAIAVTAEEVDVTTLDAGDYRDYIQGFKDPGTCELKVIWDPGLSDHGDGADGLVGLFVSGETRDCAIRWNSSGTGGEAFGTFQAFIRDMTYGALNADDPQMITPLFRLRTPVTLVDTLPATLAGQPISAFMQAEQAAREAAARAKSADISAKRLRDAANKAAAAAADRLKAAEAAEAAARTADADSLQKQADMCQEQVRMAQQAPQTAPPAAGPPPA